MIYATSTGEHFKTRLFDGEHTAYADTPIAAGGKNQNMRPGDIWASGLAACLNITAQNMLVTRGLVYDKVTVAVDMDRNNPEKVVFKIKIDIDGDISPEDKEKIRKDVQSCPVCKLMTAEKEFIFE